MLESMSSMVFLNDADKEFSLHWTGSFDLSFEGSTKEDDRVTANGTLILEAFRPLYDFATLD